MTNAQHANLLPASVREARRVRVLTRRWLCVGAMLGVVLGGGDAGLRSVFRGGDASLKAEHTMLLSKGEELRTSLEQRSKTLRDLTRRRELVSRATTRPDWGLLLATIARQRTDDVALTACRMDEVAGEQGARLALSGLGGDQQAVQAFLISLEETELFGEVTLVDTRRAISGGAELLAFNATASIVPRPDKPSATDGASARETGGTP